MIFTRKPAITLLLSYTLLATILRAFRTPNDFAEAHWLLDYRFGFVKRGLVGELLSRVSDSLSLPITESLILVLSSAAFLTYCIMLVYLTLRVIERLDGSIGAVLVSLGFLSSSFIVMSAHLMGYFDNIVIVLGILSIILLSKGKTWPSIILQSVGLLIHENSLFLAFGPYCLAWFLQFGAQQKPVSWIKSFLPLLLPLGVFPFLAVGQDIFISRDFVELYGARLAQYPFIQGDSLTGVPIWISTSFSDIFKKQSADILRRVGSVAIYILFLPSAIGTLTYILNAFKLTENRRITTILLFGMSFVPQLMHLVAWDTFRIWSYTILCSFFALWIYSERFPARRDPFEFGLIPLVILLINVLITVPLMDEQTERFSLFVRLALYLPVIAGGLALTLSQRGKSRIGSGVPTTS